MRVRILAVGKLKQGPMLHLIQDYLKRCQWKIEIAELDPNADFISRISEKKTLVLLDEKGESLTSHGFAQFIQEMQNHQVSSLTFVIGGANGVNNEVKKRANYTLAFGRATWPHMMARLMLIEQLYRAEQILKGHPYGGQRTEDRE